MLLSNILREEGANRDFDSGLKSRYKRQKNDENLFSRYNRLFDEILNTLMSNIKLRFYFLPPPKKKNVKLILFLNANNNLTCWKKKKEFPKPVDKLKNRMLPASTYFMLKMNYE